MSLSFDERDLLPLGVHETTLDEVEQVFGKSGRSDHRHSLFARLQEYSTNLRQAEIKGSLIIDGSFVMRSVDQPEDIDLVLVLPQEWDMAADLKPYQYNLVSKTRVQKECRLDVFVVQRDSPKEREWISFFQQVNIKWRQRFGWPDHLQKGIVRVEL